MIAWPRWWPHWLSERLVTIGEGQVEVAHEALLREWPRLRGWLEEDAEGRRLQRHIGAAAREWDAGGRDAGELYRGARLASALDWSVAHPAELNASERAFLDESRAASERSQRRLRALLAGVAALLVLAVIAGLVALDQRGNARQEAVAADAQRLGARALTEDDLDRSLLLARQGVALDDSLETRGNLLAALLKSPAVIGMLRGDGDRLLSLELSPDGRALAVIDDDATLSVVDTRTRRPAARPRTVVGVGIRNAGFDGLRFSNDGARLAVGGTQPVVLDAHTGRVLARVPNEHGFIHSLRFSADGRTLFAAIDSPEGATTIQRFDARSGRPLGSPRSVTARFGGVTLIVTNDGRRLVTSLEGGPTVIRDARTLRPLRQLPVGAEQAALSPDDRTMLVGGRDGSVRFLDLVRGSVRTASGRHDGAVVRAAFSADGRTAVTAGEDKRVIAWNVEGAAAGESLEGHAGQITGLAISPDGRTLHTASLDGEVLIWDLAGARRLGRPFDIGQDGQGEFSRFAPPSYALRPDGRVLAVGHNDGTVTLFDGRTLRAHSTFRAVPTGPVRGMGYVPGGRLLVVGGDDGFLATFDPRRGKLAKALPGHIGTLLTPSFSADGRLMATVSTDDVVLLWTLKSGEPLGRPRPYYPPVGALDVSLSPDGRTLAVTAGLGVEIIDVATRRQRTLLPGSETVQSLARFTPDGRFIVGGSYEGWARLWSTETWRPATRVLAGTHRRGDLAVHQPGWPHAGHGEHRRHDPPVRPAHPTAARRATARPAKPPCRAPVHAQRRLPARHHQRGARIPLGCTARLMGTTRLRRGRPPAHSNRMGRRATRARLQPGLLSITAAIASGTTPWRGRSKGATETGRLAGGEAGVRAAPRRLLPWTTTESGGRPGTDDRNPRSNAGVRRLPGRTPGARPLRELE